MRSLRLSGPMALPSPTVSWMLIEATCCLMCCVAQRTISRAGYYRLQQNPSGASISEAAQPLLVLLNGDGSLAQNLVCVGGARHNQLTTIAPLNGRWLLGGMINGPGTHSGDADRALIVADGFLREGSTCRPSELRFCTSNLPSPSMILVVNNVDCRAALRWLSSSLRWRLGTASVLEQEKEQLSGS